MITKQQIIAVLKPLAIIEVVLLLGLGLVCLLGGWHTLHDYAVAMMFAGALLVTVGPFSLSFTGQNIQMFDNDRFFHTLQRERLFQRMRNAQPHESTSLPYFAQLLIFAGAFNLGIGLALQALVA